MVTKFGFRGIFRLRLLKSMFCCLTAVACGCVSAAGRSPMSERTYFPTPVALSDSSVDVRLDDTSGVVSFRLDARGAMDGIGERPGLAKAYWGIDIVLPDDTVRLTLRHGNTAFGDIFDRRQNLLTLSRGSKKIKEVDADGFESSDGVYNTLRLGVDCLNDEVLVSGGGRRVEDVFKVSVPDVKSAVALRVWSRGELAVSSLSLETVRSPQVELSTSWTQESLIAHFRESKDSIEGYWQYLDRENDPAYARPGGRYLLAVVKAESGGYDIIYVDGAEKMRDEWKPMMLKGRLKPTIFVDHFDLEWIDSTFESLERDIHATVTDKAILALSFPLLKTVMRFSRVPTSCLSQGMSDR